MFQEAKIYLKRDTISFLFSENYFTSLDYEGRLFVAFNEGKTYKRGFDNTILCSSIKESRFLTLEESKSLTDKLYSDIKELLKKGNFSLIFTGGKKEFFDNFLNRINLIDYNHLMKDGEEFKKLFKPITILPPDQYMSLYLPITEGCSYNKCSFCNLYKDRSFRIKSIEEVKRFTQKVLEFFRYSLLTRRGIFLGEGNVFVEKTETIVESINIIKEILTSSPYVKFKPQFFGFMDTFQTKKSIEELHLLKESGVKRVYIGLESGDDFILSNILLKPSTSEDVLYTVKLIKEVGINVGLIIMVGIGGREFRERHFLYTTKLIENLPLSEGDIVYISPFVEYKHLEYSRIIDKIGLTRMTEEEIGNEVNNFKNALLKLKGVKLPIYRVDKFLYA